MKTSKTIKPVKVKRPTIEDFRKKAFKDPVFKAEYDALAPEFDIIREFIKARIEAKISQAELARRLDSQQPAIARLEKGGYANTSINTLHKFAGVMGYSLHVSLKKAKKQNV